MRIWRIVGCMLLACLVLPFPASANVKPVQFDPARNRLIAYIISHQLPAEHYSHIPFDDALSKRAFTLYLRQLDPRKRFLLKSDANELHAFSTLIDDELTRGRIVLPDNGMQLLNERVREVKKMVGPIMDRGFDPNKKDYLESDPKKIVWTSSRSALQDRWRRILKLQVLDEYLNLTEKKTKQEPQKQAGTTEARDNAAHALDKEVWSKAMTNVRERMTNYLNRLLKESRQDHYNRYFDAVARAFDPHTNYLPPTSKEDFDIHMSGSLEGIGAVLREDDGHIKVVRIIPGSAAERQGKLQAEDIILSVAEKDRTPVDISDMRLREAVSYIRGPKGTEVILTVRKPDGVTEIIPIVRDVVKIEETYVKSSLLETEQGKKIGYIKIPSFYRDFNASSDGRKGRNVTDDTRAAVVELKKKSIQGLILDLRNDGGGALTDAVDISGLFLAGGPVVQVKNSRGMIRLLKDIDPSVVYSGPLIVLVNQFSASASEILAAALQDYGRALVLGGEHTHGKGTVQALIDLNRNLPLLHLRKYDDLGALKVTIQKFYRVTGGSTQYKGVEPDVVAPSMLDYLKTGEKYLDYSLPWDTVEPVPFHPWTQFSFDPEQSRKKANAWIEKSEKFRKIQQEAKKAEERRKHSKVSVFLEGLRQERLESKQAREEAKAAGLLGPDQGDEDDAAHNREPLDKQLARDPFVTLARYLMAESESLAKDHPK